MTWSLTAKDASSSGAEIPEDASRSSTNRVLRTTAAISLAAHAALFMLGVSNLRPSDVGSVPTLTFTVQLEDGKDQEDDRAPPSQRVITLGRTQPLLSAAVNDNRPTEVSPHPDTAQSSPLPPPPGVGADDVLAPETLVAEVSSFGTEDLITTTGESELVASASVAEPDAPVTVAAIPSEQQQAMARKIVRWAQTLGATETELPSQLSWEQDGKAYTAVLKRRPALSETDIESAIVEVATLDGGKELRTQMQLKRLAFSHFAKLIDKWDSDVQLHDDEVVGRFHSNTEIVLGYDRNVAPRFRGKVTTATLDGFSIASWSRTRPRSEIFQSGFETKARRIRLPEQFLQITSNPMLRNARVHSFERDTRITFYSDGTFGWHVVGSHAREERAPLGRSPVVLMGGGGAELRVQGTVSGNVLVFSPQRIWIDGSLTYAQNPRLVPDSQDYLGLASDKYVEVAPPSITGPGDLQIDAAIYARRLFNVTAESEPFHDTLIIFGSLSAGTLSATEPRYATRIEFDPRFERKRPPGFPMTNAYEVEEWDAQWKEATGTALQP
jgi:hypothetical protein